MKNDFLCQEQCCQIFLGAAYQNRKNVPNNHKIYQMVTKYTEWLYNRPKCRKISSLARPSKIYPNMDFWFENMPSGNPGLRNFDSRFFEALARYCLHAEV
jgi:hypothetical protein